MATNILGGFGMVFLLLAYLPWPARLYRAQKAHGRGWPVAVAREAGSAWVGAFPRVPPVPMTKSEHAHWLRCCAADVQPAAFMGDAFVPRDERGRFIARTRR